MGKVKIHGTTARRVMQRGQGGEIETVGPGTAVAVIRVGQQLVEMGGERSQLSEWLDILNRCKLGRGRSAEKCFGGGREEVACRWWKPVG